MASYLEFVLEEQSYALPVEHIYAIFTLPKVIPMPHAPKHVLGVINLYGFCSPVIDLRRLWALSEKPVDGTALAIDIKINDSVLAILVDAALGVIEGNVHNIKPLTGLKYDIAEMYIEVEDRDILLLDIQKLKSKL